MNYVCYATFLTASSAVLGICLLDLLFLLFLSLFCPLWVKARPSLAQSRSSPAQLSPAQPSPAQPNPAQPVASWYDCIILRTSWNLFINSDEINWFMFQISSGIAKHPQMSLNIQKLPLTSPNVPKRPQTLQNVQKHPETSRNVQKRPGTSRNIQKCPETSQNVQKRQPVKPIPAKHDAIVYFPGLWPKRHQTSQNVHKCPQTLQNVAKCCKTFANIT